MKKIIFFLFLISVLNVNAQKYYSVIAENGLSIRETPSLSGNKIGKLEAGKDVMVLRKSGVKLNITDEGKIVKGEWFEVKETDNSPSGYVFSGFLNRKWSRPQNLCDSELPCNSTIYFDDFKVKLYNYQIEVNEKREKNDSLQIHEFVFNDIDDKLMKITPNDKSTKVEVSFTVIESIEEQYNRHKIKREQIDEWIENRVSWNGYSEYEKVENKFNFFRIPIIDYEGKENSRKINLKLRDTLVDLSGESMNVATLIYKGKPAIYGIGSVILKIDLTYKNGQKETKYLKIILSYGC
ncbi:SH3 domain-containing protein [Aureivirga sp. CE67]|uniref:SH3 domain-containing protein n=1 Tax=Aureivirga sp. CE67 TaxID=1788983 RepID=UPI0018C97ED2|nr:SH3 domain-containing protein [Aureivirga sp. CE67]